MVSSFSMIFMGISAVISIGLPIFLFLFLRKKYELKVVPMIVGAAAFILFAMVLEQLLHLLVLRPLNGEIALIKDNPILYVLYGIFAAGIFEETARYLSFILLKKKKYNGIGTGLSYGIGHGGIEAVLLAGVSMIINLVISIMINTGNAESLWNSPMATQLDTIIKTNSFMFLVSGIERMCAIAIHISLSLIVWFSVVRKDKRWLFPLAIVLHAIIDIPPALMQTGIIKSILFAESMVVVSALLLIVIAVIVCKKLKQNEEYDSVG